MHERLCHSRILVVPGLLLNIFCLSGKVTGQETLDAVFAAWSARQADVHSLRFVWTEEIRRPAPSKQGDTPAAAAVPDVEARPAIEQRCSLRIDGERMDFRLEQPEGDATRIPLFYRSSFDGEASRTLSGESEHQARSGRQDARPHAFDTNRLSLVPLTLTFRPLHPTMGRISPDQYRIMPESKKVAGHDCIVLERIGEQAVKQFYCVDTDRGYIVVRYWSTYKGEWEGVRLDIDYKEDVEHGWVPSRWKLVAAREDGNINLSTESVVVDYSINEPIPADEFVITFPEGTHVQLAGPEE